MKAKKYKHLSFEDRCIIEEFLNNNYNFTKIGNRIGKDRTTISHDSALLFLGKNNIKKIDNDDIDLSIRLLKK